MNRVLLLGHIKPSLRLGLALLLALVLLASPLAATPAAATEKPSDHQYKERDKDNDDNDNDDNDNNNRHHKKNNNRNNNNNNNGGGGAGGAFEIAQESEQAAESAEINQSFTVTSSGDNSNQCAGVQGDAQSGNAQNLFDLEQVNSETDEVEAEEVGSTIDASPTSDTTCDQQVNQAAAANATNASTDAAGASADSCYTASDGWYYCHWAGWGTYYWDPNVWNYKTCQWGDWVYWSPVSDVATGALNSAGGLATLGTLATLGLVGTGLAIRRSRSD